MERPDGHRRATLPVHPVPMARTGRPILTVDGLVEHPLRLRPEELAALTQQARTADFGCVEGWTVPQLSWQGVPLLEMLRLAGADAAARWVQASAGDFSVPLPLDAVGEALLALRLDGEDLPLAHGGPVRLVVPDQACFTSVKWLDHLEVRAAPGANTAEQTALARLR